MSISAYVGLPGHGKSYGAVANVIIPALTAKRLVYTNIPLNDEKCLSDFGMTAIPFSTDDIVKNPNWWSDVFTAGAVFVLDEVWRLWPAGLKANNVRESDKAFLAEHRHLVGENGFATEIYLVTQDLSQVASFARALVETTYRVVKLGNIGLNTRFRVDVYFGAVTGGKPPVSQREREIHGGKFKKEVYQYYKSHTKSETGGAGDETKTDKRGNAFGRLSIKLGFGLFIGCILLVWYGSGEVIDNYGGGAVVDPAVIDDVSVARPVTQVPIVPKNPPFLSKSRQFYVSMTNGSAEHLQYFFSVVFDDYRIGVSMSDLERLGYELLPITDCVVRVIGSDWSGYAMCAKQQEEKSFPEEFVANVTG